MHELGWYLIPAGLVTICVLGLYTEGTINDWLDKRRNRKRD